MNKTIEKEIDELAQKPYGEIKKLLDNPFTWEFEENGNGYQGEIVAVWENKEKGKIRLIGYETSSKSRWWNHFYSKSSCEKIIEP